MKHTAHILTPKILPWLAHKAGITEHRAEILWAAALRYAAHRVADRETSAYWQAAMDRLTELIAAEALREDAASFGWRPWSRAQARLCAAPVAALDAIHLATARAWRILGQQHLRLN